MSRNKPYSGAVLFAALLSLVLGVTMLAACQQTPPALDLATVPFCPAEDGPGMTGPVPCVFDAARVTDTANGYGGEGYRWYLYADTCPRTTVQDHQLVKCIARPDWTGDVEGEGRTN